MTKSLAGGWDDATEPLPHRPRRQVGTVVVDRHDDVDVFDEIGSVELEADVEDDDVLLQDLIEAEAEDGSDDGLDGSALRLVKVLAVVGVAGWLMALLANLLSPSNLLDTTDRQDDEPESVGEDLEGAIGGGDQQLAGGDPTAAAPLRVTGVEGPVVAPGQPDGSTETSTESSDTEPEAAAGSGGEVGPGETGTEEGSAPAAGTGGATTATAETGQPAPTGSGDARAGSGAVARPAATNDDYRSNLALLQSASVRNTNHDGSPYRNVPQSDLVLTDHYGPRSDYLSQPGGNPERSFPVANGGQFRASCEFSHFAYDDPLVHPGQPGASHLHMFFGNTDVNAFTTYDSLVNSGSSTCNGQELNRTGYWVPAMFDGTGNVRVPERIVIYYKGEGRARGNSEVYPEGAAFVTDVNLNTAPSNQGGIGGKKYTYLCTDNFSTNTGNGSQTLGNCDGSTYAGGGRWTVLEVNVKFPQCWNGQDPSDWSNFGPPTGDWYVSNCSGEFNRTLPNMEYFVNYRVDPGENTADWFLSSDVDPTTFGVSRGQPGSTSHGDWWGGWHPTVNQMWIDNCVNYRGSAPSGCGKGYLTDGGPNGSAPYDGPALRLRPEYTGPYKIPAATLLEELCPSRGRSYSRPEDAAYCEPA